MASPGHDPPVIEVEEAEAEQAKALTFSVLQHQQSTGKAIFWKAFTVVEGTGGEGKLKCNLCSTTLCSKNPSGTAGDHFKDKQCTTCVGTAGKRSAPPNKTHGDKRFKPTATKPTGQVRILVHLDGLNGITFVATIHATSPDCMHF